MKKTLLGILCFLPLSSVIGFVLMIGGFLVRAFAKNEPLANVMQPLGATLFFAGFLATIPALIVAFIWLAKSSVPQERKTVWFIVLIVGNAIALPFFWWAVIRRHAPN